MLTSTISCLWSFSWSSEWRGIIDSVPGNIRQHLFWQEKEKKSETGWIMDLDYGRGVWKERLVWAHVWCVRAGRHDEQQRCGGQDLITLHHTIQLLSSSILNIHLPLFCWFYVFWASVISLACKKRVLRESSASYFITCLTKSQAQKHQRQDISLRAFCDICFPPSLTSISLSLSLCA